MKHCKKLVVKEYSSDEEEEQTGGNISEKMVTQDDGLPKNFIKAHAMNRQRKLLSIILKLAKVDGYNDNLQIKGANGSYLEKSDIVRLLLWSVSQDKFMYGLNEFVDLLKKAGVTSEDVLNENLKARLSGSTASTNIPTNVTSEKPTVVYEDKPTNNEVFDKDYSNDMIDNYRKEQFNKNAEETYHPTPKEVTVSNGTRTLRPRKKPYDRPNVSFADVSDSD